MPLPVSLKQVAEELDALSDEMTAYINRETGELYSVSHDDASLLGEEIDEDDLPDWQKKSLPKIREIYETDTWVMLPKKFDIHEWQIMSDFVDSFENESIQEELSQAIHGKGAFRYFKDILRRRNIQDQWYQFKQMALENIAKEALETAQIPFK